MPFWAAQVQIMDMPAGIVITLPTTVARVHAHRTSRECQVVVTVEALHGAESWTLSCTGCPYRLSPT